jgi:lyso-ornithine lipid O-acyltransferase
MIGVRLRQAARAWGFGALTIGAGTGVFLGVSAARGAEAKARARDFWSGSWSRALLGLFDVELGVRGDAGAPGVGRGRGRVVVANHRSIIDIAVMLSRFGGAVLSRGEVGRWPIIGPAARAAGTIFVDRSSKHSGAEAISAMVERLEASDTICVFPEGTTHVDDEVRPFRLGAFVAAMRAGTPVVPVGLAYPLDSGAAYGGETFLEHLARLAASRTTPVFVEIGDPLTADEGEAVDQFAERCRQQVTRMVEAARARERASAH